MGILMTRFIFVRHAQSIANKEGRFIGHKDWDLSELGFEQAEALGRYMIGAGYRPDVIYSSDLLRPYHTVEPFAKAAQMEIIKNSALREIYAGEWEGQRFDDLAANVPGYQTWLNDIGNAKTDGGESVAQLYDRINTEIDRLAALHEGQTVLIATHATPIRCLSTRAALAGLDGMKDIAWASNASINIFDHDGRDIFAVELNKHDFLAELSTALPKTC